MAGSINKAIIVGNLGADPDIHTISSGTKKATISVATSRSYTDRNGQKQENTQWHRCVMWGAGPDKDALAGVAERFLKKGDKVYIEGEIEYREYEQDGVKKYMTEIRVREMQMLGGNGGGGGGGASRQTTQRQPAQRQTAGAGAGGDFAEPEIDDLPF